MAKGRQNAAETPRNRPKEGRTRFSPQLAASLANPLSKAAKNQNNPAAKERIEERRLLARGF
jgi:hypothetical protein